MNQENTAAKPERAEEMLRRLAAMEDLLRQQTVQNQKAARGRGLMAGLAVLLAGLLAAGLLWVNLTLASAVQGLPRLTETTGAAMEQLTATLKEVDDFDMEALNGTMAGVETALEEIDLEALNQSIRDLQEAVEGLRNFTDMFR